MIIDLDAHQGNGHEPDFSSNSTFFSLKACDGLSKFVSSSANEPVTSPLYWTKSYFSLEQLVSLSSDIDSPDDMDTVFPIEQAYLSDKGLILTFSALFLWTKILIT